MKRLLCLGLFAVTIMVSAGSYASAPPTEKAQFDSGDECSFASSLADQNVFANEIHLASYQLNDIRVVNISTTDALIKAIYSGLKLDAFHISLYFTEGDRRIRHSFHYTVPKPCKGYAKLNRSDVLTLSRKS